MGLFFHIAINKVIRSLLIVKIVVAQDITHHPKHDAAAALRIIKLFKANWETFRRSHTITLSDCCPAQSYTIIIIIVCLVFIIIHTCTFTFSSIELYVLGTLTGPFTEIHIYILSQVSDNINYSITN